MTITFELWMLVVAGIIILCVGWGIGNKLSEDTEEIDLSEDYQIIEDLKREERELHARLELLRDKEYSIQTGKFVASHYEEALEVYERLGIKIPLDIIEELTYLNGFRTKDEVMSYIETMRNNWKQENSKKVGKLT
ncbi:hypothetical protein [Bacillus phage SRT01hs]|uniref:Uncharacterized protein n=1 Tax=Bacillus phage SRT01hs TaxID=2847044 RepID=A0A6B9SW73_9CAUD|nr:GP16.7-like replication protein [Bacillus phage SRT01hs]QHJ75884.1 hypothetical protein [Bacillus phage SRT01hs]